MTGRNRVRYTQERKDEIVKRMMPPQNESVAKLSKEESITEVTLYKWRKEARAAGTATPGNGQTSDKWSSQDKFLIVMETFSMNELELAEYCRKKGLYREQIEAWKSVCLHGQAFDQAKQLNVQLKEEQQRAKALEKDLQKKEKALAEAAALILLRKKAQAIWGDDEEE
nr:transposase [Bacillus massiliglaciei]